MTALDERPSLLEEYPWSTPEPEDVAALERITTPAPGLSTFRTAYWSDAHHDARQEAYSAARSAPATHPDSCTCRGCLLDRYAP